MRKHTELLKFRSEVYTRVKAVLLTDYLIKELPFSDLNRLKSIYMYDFYDNIKRLTSEVTLLNDNKGLKTTKCVTFLSVLEIQLKNILFLTKKIAIGKAKRAKKLEKERAVIQKGLVDEHKKKKVLNKKTCNE